MVLAALTPGTLACTVIVNVTGRGGGGGPEVAPPPPQEPVAMKKAATPIRNSTVAAGRSFGRRPTIPNRMLAISKTASGGGVRGRLPRFVQGGGVAGGTAAGRESTCTVSVSE